MKGIMVGSRGGGALTRGEWLHCASVGMMRASGVAAESGEVALGALFGPPAPARLARTSSLGLLGSDLLSELSVCLASLPEVEVEFATLGDEDSGKEWKEFALVCNSIFRGRSAREELRLAREITQLRKHALAAFAFKKPNKDARQKARRLRSLMLSSVMTGTATYRCLLNTWAESKTSVLIRRDANEMWDMITFRPEKVSTEKRTEVDEIILVGNEDLAAATKHPPPPQGRYTIDDARDILSRVSLTQTEKQSQHQTKRKIQESMLPLKFTRLEAEVIQEEELLLQPKQEETEAA